MTDNTTPDLTGRQIDALRALRDLADRDDLKATAANVGGMLGVTRHTAKSHIRELRQAGVSVEYDHGRGEYVAETSADRGHDVEIEGGDVAKEPLSPAGEKWLADGTPDGCTHPSCDCERGRCEAEDADPSEDSDDGEETAEDAELTRRERYVLNRLPASAAELAADLEVAQAVVTAHIDAARSKGYDVRHDDKNRAYYLPNADAKRKIGSEDMGQITRRANDWFTEAEDRQLRQLRSVEPVTAVQNPTEHGEDVVGVLSDVHVGQDVEIEGTGEAVYSEQQWRDAIRAFGEKCISIPDRMVSPHIHFDTFHLVLNGDFVTNENIYQHQIEDIGAFLAEQIDICVDELLPVIFGLAERYPTVNVMCQVGNHGELRAQGQTREANADLLVYRALKRVLSHADYENVNFQASDSTPYTLFDTRGGEWRSLATHGEAAYEQITGTSASDSQMENWLVGFDPTPDTFYLAHYHEFRRAPVDGIPAIRTPSPKPGGPHEFEIGALQAAHAQPKLGYIHGVSDTRPITWSAVMDMESSHDPDHATAEADA